MVLLIGGQVRSGTTPLRSLCNSHLEIALTHEFEYLFGLEQAYVEHTHLLLGKLWEKIRDGNLWDSDMYAFVLLYLIRMRRYRDGLINIAAIEATLRSIFPKASIVGDKSPGYVYSLDRFVVTSELFCLIIFRDCRDVASSTLENVRTKWRKTHWTQTIDTAEKVAKSWVRSMEIMERHKDKIHIIRYEDLVREPRRELEALARWLGVDSSGFSERAIRSIRDTSIVKYKTGLTHEELKTVIEIAGPTMARLGYY